MTTLSDVVDVLDEPGAVVHPGEVDLGGDDGEDGRDGLLEVELGGVEQGDAGGGLEEGGHAGVVGVAAHHLVAGGLVARAHRAGVRAAGPDADAPVDGRGDVAAVAGERMHRNDEVGADARPGTHVGVDGLRVNEHAGVEDVLGVEDRLEPGEQREHLRGVHA